MGVRLTKQQDLLEGSEWLRAVVTHHQKSKTGVNGFESFTVEPVYYIREHEQQQDWDEGLGEYFMAGCVRHRRVNVVFKNGKDQKQEVNWIVKSANCDSEDNRTSVHVLSHEIKVQMSLLSQIHKYLGDHENIRAKFLLNLPEFIFQERKCQNGALQRCHLVLEDLTRTKNCLPIDWAQMESGLQHNYFKVFLGSLAQFHAVSLAYNLSLKDMDSLLNAFPFLQRNTSVSMQTIDAKVRDRALGMYEKLLKWQHRKRKTVDEDFKRRIKLINVLKIKGDDLMNEQRQRNNNHMRNDPLMCVCLGPVLPNEILFQCDRFNQGQNQPICAAVNSCQRVHYGSIVSELSLFFLALACPDVRSKGMLVSCLQTYCHVLTSTLEVLEVDWIRQFQISFPQFVLKFQSFVAQALLKSIVLHMRLTDPKELDRLAHSTQEGSSSSLKDKISVKYVPLTKKRINFLVRLTDLVPETI